MPPVEDNQIPANTPLAAPPASPANPQGSEELVRTKAEFEALRKVHEETLGKYKELESASQNLTMIQGQLAVKDEYLKKVLQTRYEAAPAYIRETMTLEELPLDPLEALDQLEKASALVEDLEKQIREKYGIKDNPPDPTRRAPGQDMNSQYDMTKRSGLMQYLAAKRQGEHHE